MLKMIDALKWAQIREKTTILMLCEPAEDYGLPSYNSVPCACRYWVKSTKRKHPFENSKSRKIS